MKSRRKSIFSNPREQSKIIAVFSFMAAAFVAVNCHVSKHAVQGMYDGLAASHLPASAAKTWRSSSTSRTKP